MENVRPDGSIVLPGTMVYWTPGEFGDKVFCIKQDLMFYNPVEKPSWWDEDDERDIGRPTPPREEVKNEAAQLLPVYPKNSN